MVASGGLVSVDWQPVQSPTQSWPLCSDLRLTRCIASFSTTSPVAPADLQLQVFGSGASLQVQLTRTGVNDLTRYDLGQLSSPLDAATGVHIVLNVGDLDPVVFGTTGGLTSYSTTIDPTPSPASGNT